MLPLTVSTEQWIKELAMYAGPIALAAFAGVFLGGICLSFFWKNFGPWKLLDAARAELAKCQAHRDEAAIENARILAQMADLHARYEIVIDAVNRAGLGIGLNNHQPRGI